MHDDVRQREVLAALEQLRARLERPALRHPPPTHALYIWGGVGRGKTMLMDLFFAQTGQVDKRRTHFDAFMRDLHAAQPRGPKRGPGRPAGGRGAQDRRVDQAARAR